MRFLALVLLLNGCVTLTVKPGSRVGIVTSLTSDNEIVYNIMYEACNTGYTVVKKIKNDISTEIYFRCE